MCDFYENESFALRSEFSYEHACACVGKCAHEDDKAMNMARASLSR